MEQDDLYIWLSSTFSSLPRVTEEGYKAIWRKGALHFNEKNGTPDLIDELCARLICMALTERRQILIILPDRQPRRGALLFATALLLESMDRVESHRRGGQVLYFGSAIGIREHLSHVYINDLCLASVFPQVRLQRNLDIKKMPLKDSKSKSSSRATFAFSLPTVLCVYSPGDPIAVIERNKATWFAVDCADDTKLLWLKPIVEFAAQHKRPLIAWVQNPLSSVIEDFRMAGGQVFTWPIVTNSQSLPPLNTSVVDGLHKVFSDFSQHIIQPLLIENPKARVGIDHLQHAYFDLSKVVNLASSADASHLVWGAIQISWKYLRTLENLCVPLNLFETEIKNFWGTSSPLRIREGLNKYIDALATWKSSIYTTLIDVQRHLQEAHSQFEKQEPPLWTTLSNLCVENVASGKARLFVFPTNSSRKLFGLSLLAYFNITEDDLKQLHIGLISLRELYDFLTLPPQEDIINEQTLRLLAGLPSTNLKWEYCLVGMPSWTSIRYLDPVLRQDGFQIVVYPYQVTTLTKRVEQWETAVYPGVVKFADTIAVMTKYKPPLIDPCDKIPRLALQSIQRLKSETSSKSETTIIKKTDIWEPYDPLEEFARLMHTDIEEDTPVIFSRPNGQTGDVVDGAVAEFVEEVWLIEFHNGEYVLLSTDEKVNVIIYTSRSSKTDERYASSLRAGDWIVFIHGQRKQSLLDLVISRVYRNPAVNLHVKLVERWQEDFAAAYQHRMLNTHKWNFDSLFKEMKARGSRISSPQPLRYWLHGETLRPQDQEDLRRLAEVLELEFVRQHYKRIHQAGSRLAGLHVSLSRRLNAWLSNEAPDIVANATTQDDMIDEQLGLTFQDFRDSLSILQVRSVSKERGLFGRDMLGQLEREKVN